MGSTKEKKIKRAWKSPGGWEGWVQVELYYAFGYFATREDHAYEHPSGRQSQRTDFGFNSGPMVLKQEKIANESILLELKCESAHNKNFKYGVAKDIQKIEGDIKGQWWVDGGCTLYAIVLSMSVDGGKDMKKLGMKRYYNSGTRPRPPFKLWWKMVHRPPNHFAHENEPGFDYRLASRRTKADRYCSGGPVSYDDVDYNSDWDSDNNEGDNSNINNKKEEEDDSDSDDNGSDDNGSDDNGSDDIKSDDNGSDDSESDNSESDGSGKNDNGSDDSETDEMDVD